LTGFNAVLSVDLRIEWNLFPVSYPVESDASAYPSDDIIKEARSRHSVYFLTRIGGRSPMNILSHIFQCWMGRV